MRRKIRCSEVMTASSGVFAPAFRSWRRCPSWSRISCSEKCLLSRLPQSTFLEWRGWERTRGWSRGAEWRRLARSSCEPWSGCVAGFVYIHLYVWLLLCTFFFRSFSFFHRWSFIGAELLGAVLLGTGTGCGSESGARSTRRARHDGCRGCRNPLSVE